MRRKRSHRSLLIYLLSVIALALFCLRMATLPRTLVVLATADVHGALFDFNYEKDAPRPGTDIARIATYVQSQRATGVPTLLFDAGDLLYDNHLEFFRHDRVHPFVAALNRIGYDGWTPGNHEFTYPADDLFRHFGAFDGDVLLANVRYASGDYLPHAVPYAVYARDGLRVGVIGLTLETTAEWEYAAPDHYGNAIFTDALDAARDAAARLRGQTDLIVVVMHASFLDLGNAYWKETQSDDLPSAYAVGAEGGPAVVPASSATDALALLCECPDIDAVLLGHDHALQAQALAGGRVLLEPGAYGAYVSKLVVRYLPGDDGARILSLTGENVPMTDVAPDETVRALLASTDAALRAENARVVSFADAHLSAACTRKLLLYVLRDAAGADAALLDFDGDLSGIAAGAFTVHDAASVCDATATLKAVRLTAAQRLRILTGYASVFRRDGYLLLPADLPPDAECTLALTNVAYARLFNAGWIESDAQVYESWDAAPETPTVRALFLKYLENDGAGRIVVPDDTRDRVWVLSACY